VLPSPQFRQWNQAAQMWLARVRSENPGLPIRGPVNCRALFFRDAFRGDAVGYYQALADALGEARIVFDDQLIVSWDGSRLFKDHVNPRIEVELTPHPRAEEDDSPTAGTLAAKPGAAVFWDQEQ
jgi:hypothetical protein